MKTPHAWDRTCDPPSRWDAEEFQRFYPFGYINYVILHAYHANQHTLHKAHVLYTGAFYTKLINITVVDPTREGTKVRWSYYIILYYGRPYWMIMNNVVLVSLVNTEEICIASNSLAITSPSARALLVTENSESQKVQCSRVRRKVMHEPAPGSIYV